MSEGIISLTPRLAATASLVPVCDCVADIGTDHAYLPVNLIQNGVARRAFACDVASGPLKSACATIAQYGLEDKITAVLSDGLDGLAPCSADCYVFAGMGGTLISELLLRARQRADVPAHLVLQPQSRSEELRQYLCINGYEIRRELAVFEGSRVYIAFDAEYTGISLYGDEAYYWIGTYNPSDGAAHAEYLRRQRHRLNDIIGGLARDGKDVLREKRLMSVISHIDEVLNA